MASQYLLRGKKANRQRKRANYEPDVPTCARCVAFRGASMYLVNSLPRWKPAHCLLNNVSVNERGCCDFWKSKKTGESLESARSSAA